MNKWIEKIPFKKIVIFYIILVILVGIILMVWIGRKFQSKINFVYDYHTIQENSYNWEEIKDNLQAMSDKSEDVVDILVLDNENKITYTSKKSEFADQEKFSLTKAENMPNGYFTSSTNDNIIFRLTSDKELMITTVLSNFDTEIQKESEDEVFYQENYQEKKIFLLSYLGNKNTGEKIYFITEMHQIPNGRTYIKYTLAIIMFLFMIYWVLLALYIYQNALKSKLNPYLWGGITLITNIAGVVIYLIYKQNQKTCFQCGALQSKNHIYCVHCGTKLNETCNQCGSVINEQDHYCARCGKKQR